MPTIDENEALRISVQVIGKKLVEARDEISALKARLAKYESVVSNLRNALENSSVIKAYAITKKHPPITIGGEYVRALEQSLSQLDLQAARGEGEAMNKEISKSHPSLRSRGGWE